MTTPWTITAGAPALPLDAGRRATATFTVTNRGERLDRAVVDLVTDAPVVRGWLTLPEPQRAVAPGATTTYQAALAVPADVPPGPHWLAARVYSADTAPEESSTVSDRVAFEVPAAQAPRKRPWWPYAAAAALVVVVLAVVGVLVLGHRTAPPATTSTAAPTAAPVPVPNLHGRTPDQAQADLAAAHLALGIQRHRLQPPDVGQVVDQSVPVGTTVPPGTSVDIVVAVALPAPAPLSPPNGVVLRLPGGGFPQLAWSPVPSASKYEVTVGARDCFGSPFPFPAQPALGNCTSGASQTFPLLPGDTTTFTPTLNLPGALPGQVVDVFWSVAAVDDFGNKGQALSATFLLNRF